jgi:hypothetical protein
MLYKCVVKKGPFHFFADKHEDVVASENKSLIYEYANKTKVDIRSTSEDDVEKNFEICAMLIRGIEMVYSTPQSKAVSNLVDFFIFIYPKQLFCFRCLQSAGIDLERAKNMQRDKGYASDEEYSKKQRKRQRISQDSTRNSNPAVQRFRQHAEGLQQRAVEMRQASVEVEMDDRDERDLNDFLREAGDEIQV